VLDQHPDRDLIRQPDARPGQPAIGDLAPQHLEVLGHPGGKPVAELRVGVEPLELMVRAGHLEGGPGDLRGTRQRGGGARVEQPRPAPHQRHQEELGHRVQVERQQRAVGVGRLRAGGRHRRQRPGGPPVPSRHRDRKLQTVVHHGARAHHRRPFVDQPAPGRIPVALRPRQPDPVAVTRHVQGVRAADIGYPGSLRRRPDDPGPAGQPPPSRNRQVNLGTPPEYQMTAFGEPDYLARRGTHMRSHEITISPAGPPPTPPDSGVVPGPAMRLTPVDEGSGSARNHPDGGWEGGSTGRGASDGLGVTRYCHGGGARHLARTLRRRKRSWSVAVEPGSVRNKGI
jgi:hypothetical protein